MASSLSTIGQGCFGKVYRRTYEGKEAAIKRVPEHLIDERSYQREFNIYQELDHPNIVKLLGRPWKEDYKWHFPLEFITGEELETALFKRQMSKIQLTLPVKATIITGMCQGLTYLHQKRIVHQDLKPDNIMIEYGSNRPVLIDFGVAKILYAGGILTAPNIGNEAYAPLEVLRGSLRGKHSEFWAMGKIVAELLLEIRLEIERYRTWDLSKQLEGSPYLEPLTKILNDNYHLRASMDAVVGSLVKAGESLSLEQKPKPTQEKAPRASAFVGPSERFMGIPPIQRSNFPQIRPTLFNSPAHRWGDMGISGGLRQLQIREPSLLPGNGSPFLGRDSLFDRGPSRLLDMPQGAFVQESHQFYRYEEVSSRGEGGDRVMKGQMEKSQGEVVKCEMDDHSVKW